MNGTLSLARIDIILSHPSHPGNIGAAARAMKTMGLSRLTLVAPKRFPDEEATARASGASDVLAQARVCSTLEEALADTVLVAGITARRRDLAAPFHWARGGAAELLAGTQQGTRDVALLFGNETAGLSNDELAHCHLGIMIPANPDYSSLNLGAAVQLMCYELRLAALSPGEPPRGEFAPATSDEVEGLHAHLERVAIATGFLDPAQPKRLMPRLRRLFARARLEHEEVSILRGLLSTIEQPKRRNKS
ncbi:putative methyltransferase [Sterolibacterium denitrificans]|uniref:Methyltransferase n=2 Tax=Sterolibacterium denitrificans TaxID=157592 RepID=A0A7Z7MVZ7_9PROT|nr:RNA methyltransferase [Sterolibacterium denitrificans]KYC29258.1 tRNA (cytidine/uridine-2'-O-)-methyltransferase [Sterolibacterium denitrificans]SMB30170.1 putative methyltransferase [Sterolibacterium denitrificans]